MVVFIINGKDRKKFIRDKTFEYKKRLVDVENAIKEDIVDVATKTELTTEYIYKCLDQRKDVVFNFFSIHYIPYEEVIDIEKNSNDLSAVCRRLINSFL
jgi:4-diphosphocytidyl-2C-methyl-D-erythritol kinase